jgi:hypothetical protein
VHNGAGCPDKYAVKKAMKMTARSDLEAYYRAGKPLVCELETNPYLCEFWPRAELDKYNEEYEIEQYAPGFFGFATSGGGEMYAISPSDSIVVLPFIGMEPEVAVEIASSWSKFEGMLRNAF